MNKYFLLCMIVGLCGCSNKQSEKITVEEARSMMNEEAIILDVREADEYESGHIPNAIQLSVNELEAKAIEVLSDKQQVILIYCRSGNRSAQASKILNKLNYEQVYDFGGINDWPYEIEKN